MSDSSVFNKASSTFIKSFDQIKKRIEDMEAVMEDVLFELSYSHARENDAQKECEQLAASLADIKMAAKLSAPGFAQEIERRTFNSDSYIKTIKKEAKLKITTELMALIGAGATCSEIMETIINMDKELRGETESLN